MQEEQVLVCPFCGAPHGESIPAGVVQVKCHYCGAMVLVPPRLGGIVQRCPNHPETLAMGLCNDCGKSFCDQCLYVWEVQHGKLYICSKCYRNRSGMQSVSTVLSIVFSIIFILLFLVVITRPLPSSDGSPIAVLFTGFLFLALSVSVYLGSKKKPVSVHDFLSRAGYTSRAYLKKCVGCGREIPIASEQCQYCEARQPEYTG